MNSVKLGIGRTTVRASGVRLRGVWYVTGPRGCGVSRSRQTAMWVAGVR